MNYSRKTFNDILAEIDKLLKVKKKVIVGIDGPCGSGKTTLAQELAEFYKAQVIHMDDFFLPPALRTEERLSEPGGNIHYERFLQEVVANIKETDTFKYRIFSCRIMDYSGEAEIDLNSEVHSNSIVIVEGSYSMHPLYDSIYDLKIFCDITSEEQKERIIKRNGLEVYKNFETKWIPMEKIYFKFFNIKEACHMILE